jgi:hypothetical protein
MWSQSVPWSGQRRPSFSRAWHCPFARAFVCARSWGQFEGKRLRLSLPDHFGEDEFSGMLIPCISILPCLGRFALLFFFLRVVLV